jgi:hypothetical protein
MRAFGVSVGPGVSSLADPVLTLFDSAGATIVSNNDWQTNTSATAAAISNATVAAGLPPLGSTLDAALLVPISLGTYTAQVTGFGGSSGEFVLEIALTDAIRPTTIPPAIIFLSRHQFAVSNGSATFAVHVLANPAPTYQWRRNGAIIPGASSPVLTLNSLTPSAHGSTVDVQITSGATTITSAPRSIFMLPDYHSADTNRDGRIDIVELTRVIQLFNHTVANVRTGEYRTQADTEDGYAPGFGAITNHHAADTNKDGKISGPELSRVIELYNYVNGTVRTGEYHSAVGTEDGFALGPIPSVF